MSRYVWVRLTEAQARALHGAVANYVNSHEGEEYQPRDLDVVERADDALLKAIREASQPVRAVKPQPQPKTPDRCVASVDAPGWCVTHASMLDPWFTPPLCQEAKRRGLSWSLA